ncbi:hypothetical protein CAUPRSCDRAFT_11536 [Caulochytrium protostelioides]|uniref:Uncharacterized protein n=1 Tax=Caulochytrium protostelioides TaxID=1555241 RepID=A0A4P9WWT9_9FUNG|nr:hypothetical protein CAUPRSCDRAFT_11536 [Caulochytrium protostelioides]
MIRPGGSGCRAETHQRAVRMARPNGRETAPPPRPQRPLRRIGASRCFTLLVSQGAPAVGWRITRAPPHGFEAIAAPASCRRRVTTAFKPVGAGRLIRGNGGGALPDGRERLRAFAPRPASSNWIGWLAGWLAALRRVAPPTLGCAAGRAVLRAVLASRRRGPRRGRRRRGGHDRFP